jgi:NAD(P)-dependent dehydrogenase (short-subunit alcohol dehydrogenase family)
MPDEGTLEGRVALVTGAGSGIGRAISLLFAKEAAAVAAMDVDRAAGEAVLRELEAGGYKGIYVHGDVSTAADCERAVRDTSDHFGRLDILVNNAGIIHRASVVDLPEEDWDRAMAVNVKSVFLLSKYAVPMIAEVGGGSIINVGSGWGLVGGQKAAAYCASKGAVVQLTRAMALDHGRQGVRVNCICPGDTDTAMLRSEAEQLGKDLEEFLGESAQRPLGRMGSPEDVAQAALYLASNASSFVTGTTLVVDGGGLAGS